MGTVDEGQLDDAGAAVPVAGANVCWLTPPGLSCMSTGDDGAFSIPAPPAPADGGGFDVALVATAAGHLGSAGLGNFGSTPVAFYVYPSALILKTDASAARWAGQAGFTYPANGTAFIEMWLRAGASATLAPASGKGPVYGDAAATPSPALTAATSSGVVWFGNVTPGPFTITVTAPGKTCFQASSGKTHRGRLAGPHRELAERYHRRRRPTVRPHHAVRMKRRRTEARPHTPTLRAATPRHRAARALQVSSPLSVTAGEIQRMPSTPTSV